MNYEDFIKDFMKSKMGIKEEDKGFIAIKTLFEEFCLRVYEAREDGLLLEGRKR